MQFDDVVLGRRSIRGYKPDPVPKPVIREVIAMAMRAPSSLNTQPWNFFVVTGAPLARIRAGNTERNLAGVPASREFRSHGEYAGAHRERQIGIAKQLFDAMGIERHDKDARQDWELRGFRQYAAPACVVDSQGSMQSPGVREHAGIPDDQVIMICVAIGYPDDSFPANAVVSQRKSVDDAVTFVGFD